MSITPKARFWQKPYISWLFSIRSGVVLLSIVAVASIAGTLIEDLKRAQALVYYSLWYRTLLLLLAANIACATHRTIIEKILPGRKVRLQDSPRFYEGLSPSATIPFHGTPEAVADAFRREGFRVRAEKNAGYAVKGAMGRWGAPISHIGFIIILVAGFASKWTSREGTVRIAEGESSDTMVVWDQPPREVPLGFIIHVENYTMDYFPNTRPPVPSSYISTVSIFSNDGQHQVTQPVEVNRSLKTHGWTLHQTSFEPYDQGERLLVDIGAYTLDGLRWAPSDADDPSMKIRSEGGVTTATLEISPGQTRTIPDVSGAGATIDFALSSERPRRWTVVSNGRHYHGELASTVSDKVLLKAERFEPDLVIGPDRQVTSRSRELNNPALLVSVLEEGQIVAHPWLFAREDLKEMMHQESGPVELELLEVTGSAPNYGFIVAARRTGTTDEPARVTLRLGEETPIASPETVPAATQPIENLAEAGPYSVRNIQRVPAFYTTLTLTRNPSIPVIYFGCGVMMLGLMIAFVFSRREVWFAVDPNANVLRVGAMYRHPQAEFDSSTTKTLDRLRED